MRHRSTANCRATATIAFLRAAPVASAPFASRCLHFLTARYSGWKRTRRQANSTSAARKRGLPCLVTQLCSRVLPLLYSPGAEAGVAGDLAPIVKAVPIANLSVDDHAGHFPQPAWLFGRCSTLQLHGQCRDLLL